MSNKLYIVGIGPGSAELILPVAMETILKSDVLIGGRRNLDLFNELEKEKIIIGNNLDEIAAFIMENISEKKIALLASGDPGIYSITGYLKKNLEEVEIEVVPGISSLQYFCCKLKTSWNDVFITSVHGRQQDDLMGILRKYPKVAVFTGGEHTPDWICREMAVNGITGARVHVGENLSYPEERIVSGSSERIGKLKFEELAIMLIEKEQEEETFKNPWQHTVHGIPDEFFLRGSVPMTKQEVRAISISKLRLNEDSIIYDIGAGTGSVSVECALKAGKGFVYAFEHKDEAVELIGKNVEKFQAKNVKIVLGEAPYAFLDTPRPDRIFIGGSGGNMGEILEWIRKECTDVRIVINTVTIESTYEAIEGLEKMGFEDIEITNIAIARSKAAGGKHLMQALNPVYIISAAHGGRK